MTASHSYINMREVMYGSSHFAFSDVSPVQWLIYGTPPPPKGQHPTSRDPSSPRAFFITNVIVSLLSFVIIKSNHIVPIYISQTNKLHFTVSYSLWACTSWGYFGLVADMPQHPHPHPPRPHILIVLVIDQKSMFYCCNIRYAD